MHCPNMSVKFEVSLCLLDLKSKDLKIDFLALRNQITDAKGYHLCYQPSNFVARDVLRPIRAPEH